MLVFHILKLVTSQLNIDSAVLITFSGSGIFGLGGYMGFNSRGGGALALLFCPRRGCPDALAPVESGSDSEHHKDINDTINTTPIL